MKIEVRKDQYLFESFLDYWSGPIGWSSKPATFSIYKNPTRNEIEEYIPDNARGWLMPNGDIYMEGKNPEGGREDLTHNELISALFKLGIFKNYPSNYDSIWHHATMLKPLKYGVGIIRLGIGNEIYLAESYYAKGIINAKEELKKLNDIASKKNPSLKIKLKRIKDL